MPNPSQKLFWDCLNGHKMFVIYIFFFLSFYLSISLSISLSIYLPIYLSIYLPTHLSTHLSIYLSTIYLLSIYYLSTICLLSIYYLSTIYLLSIHPPTYLSTYLYIYFSICLSWTSFIIYINMCVYLRKNRLSLLQHRALFQEVGKEKARCIGCPQATELNLVRPP